MEWMKQNHATLSRMLPERMWRHKCCLAYTSAPACGWLGHSCSRIVLAYVIQTANIQLYSAWSSSYSMRRMAPCCPSFFVVCKRHLYEITRFTPNKFCGKSATVILELGKLHVGMVTHYAELLLQRPPAERRPPETAEQNLPPLITSSRSSDQIRRSHFGSLWVKRSAITMFISHSVSRSRAQLTSQVATSAPA